MAESSNSSVVFLLLLLITGAALNSAHAAVPAIFVLGDSTADVGTNNHFNETSIIAKADFSPYGIDFPGGRATGRFSNGYNSADYLAKHMGFRRSPRAYLDLVDQVTLQPTKNVLKGVNFASGGSGILYNTGRILGRVVSMDEQIEQVTAVRQKIETILSQNGTDIFLSKSMFVISVGSNDIFEHFASNNTSDQEFIVSLITTYEAHLRALYSLGARKFGIISAPLIGCCPSQRVKSKKGECLEPLNEFSQLFHSVIDTMLQKLGSEYEDMKYSLGNAFQMVADMMANPQAFKFTEVQSACCGNGILNGEFDCSPSSNLCPNRDEYLFWDWYHPTRAAAKLAALTLYTAAPHYVSPINFSQLQYA